MAGEANISDYVHCTDALECHRFNPCICHDAVGLSVMLSHPSNCLKREATKPVVTSFN